MRIGIVGAGWMGAQHAAAYAAMPDVEVAGVVGRTPARAEALAAKQGTRAVAALRELLDDASVDAVDVSVPTSLHEEVCGAAFDAGKHVLCETPLAHDAAAGERMASRARRAGRLLQVALLTRFARPLTVLHEVLTTGSMGAPYAVHLDRLAPGTSGQHHGDVLEEILLFDLDVAVRALGPPRRVACSAVRGPSGRLDHVTAVLEHERCAVTCVATYLSPRGLPFTAGFRAWFEHGHLEGRFTDGERGPSVEVARTPRDGPASVDRALGPDPVVAECRHFADVVLGRADPALLDASQAVLGLRVLDALRDAARAGLTSCGGRGDGPRGA